jgi:hypothetical protein
VADAHPVEVAVARVLGVGRPRTRRRRCRTATRSSRRDSGAEGGAGPALYAPRAPS